MSAEFDDITTSHSVPFVLQTLNYYRHRWDDCTKWSEAELRFQRFGTRSVWQWDNWPSPQSIWGRG